MKRSLLRRCLRRARCVSVAKAQDVPTIRVGWTIPAEEAKYWMMRRPEKFPNLGKGYKIEWSQFQGTSPMAQALIAGALDCATQGVLPIAQGMDKNTLSTYVVGAACRREAGQLLGLLGGEGRLADQEGRGPEGQDRRHLDHRRRHARAVRPDAQARTASIPRRTSSWSRCRSRSPRMRCARAASMRPTWTSRSRRAPRRRAASASCSRSTEAVPNIVHIVEACRKDFVDKNPELVKQYVKDITAGAEDGARQPRRDHEGRDRDHQGADRGARHVSAEAERLRARAGRRAELRRASRRCSTSIPTTR